MMMKNKIILALLITLIITFSGCISAQQETEVGVGYAGVDFTAFYPVAQEVYAGSSVTLYLSVQNNGYFNAGDVIVALYNCGNINNGTTTWRTESGDGKYKCNDIMIPEDQDLEKPDRELGVSGEVVEAEVKLDVPLDFPEGRTPHVFSARVGYSYNTTATRDIVMTTFQNWKEKGGSIEIGALTMTSSPAPLSLSINAPSKPIIITSENPDQEFSVALQIRNSGGGSVSPDKRVESIELCFDPDFVEPIMRSDGRYGDFDVKDNDCLRVTSDEVRTLIGITNQWRDIDASFNIVADSVVVQEITGFEATLTYKYTKDISTQVIVIG